MSKFSYNLPKDLYKGMRVRPTLDMIANSIEHDPYRIKYPDREATFYLNSPQFLSLLQDTYTGLAEQSKRIEKQKMAENIARLNNVGGSVDTAAYETASDGGGSDVGMMSPRSLERQNLEARARRAREERERLAKQEEDRRRQEQADYEYAQFLRRQEEEARRIQQELAQQSMALTPLHPIASSAASAAVPGYTQEQLKRMAQSFLESLNAPRLTIFGELTREERERRQGIVPRPVSVFGSTPFRLPPDVMADAPPSGMQIKRRSESELLPIAKAKPGPVIEEVEEEEPTKATTPVKKKGVKRAEESAQQQELKQLLDNNRVYPIADIRKKFKDNFPSIKTIIAIDKASGSSRDMLIDRAPRADIIAEYIHEITKKGKLLNELRGIKKETETRLAAVALPGSSSGDYKPAGKK